MWIDVRIDGDGAFQELTGARTDEDVEAMRAAGKLIDLPPDGSIILTGFEHGMESGAPSVALGFRLPDGRVVIAQTSWRLFATAFHQFAGAFKTPYPDMTGMELLAPALGSKTVVVGDDEPRFMVCALCGERADFPPQSAGGQPAEPLWWLRDHFEERHPDVVALRGPDPRAGVRRCAPDDHHWVPVEEGSPIGAPEMCDKCMELRW